MWRQPKRILAAVAVGGAAGTSARYGLGLLFPDPVGTGFPWTTFGVNVVGCLAIGVLAGALDRARTAPPLIRPLLGSGFLGGFTTFSTYADQTRALMLSGRWSIAAAYVLGTLVAAMLSVWLGLRLAGRWRAQ
jgi:fluoride exporter